MEHHNHHHHHHHAAAGDMKSLNGVFIFAILLNLLFVGIEAAVGFLHNSLSLLSDAGHNLSDVFSLVLVLFSFYLLRVHSTKRYSYGLKKSTVLISLLNAIILLVAVGAIIIESIHKFVEPVEVDGAAVSWTALAGIVVNGLTVLLLMRGQKSDINVRGAFLHMVADTLVSVGVVISGVAITLTGWNVIDPIVSLIIAAVIIFSTWHLLSESLKLSLDGTPESIAPDAVTAIMAETPGVRDVHHVHIWAISTTQNALTAHLVVDDLSAMERIKNEVREKLRGAGIAHATLETEAAGCHCHEHDCHCGE
ncbi:MAG: cation diffusion facilitator family transporter [Prevotella sp.]|nr:cation diffusion facilitator family transporter [Prevotella sp.]